MRVIDFITQPALIDRILDHLRRRQGVTIPPDGEPRSVVLDPRDLVLLDAEIAPAAGPR